jgi:Glycogen recognition site of AMP-activated protein kinase
MTTEIVPVTFRFPSALAPGANHIAILGPFNGWNPQIHLMTKTPQDYWVIKIYQPPGRTVYCFDVDGAYWLDPNDEGRIPNGWGAEYSVRYVRGANPYPPIQKAHRTSY